jgi:predicted PurR-regulated permease PerM
MSDIHSRVPVRTIMATIGLVLATVVAVELIMRVEQVLVWMVIALVFTVALCPVVNWTQRHLSPPLRSLATLIIYVIVVLALGGLLAVFAIARPSRPPRLPAVRQIPVESSKLSLTRRTLAALIGSMADALSHLMVFRPISTAA